MTEETGWEMGLGKATEMRRRQLGLSRKDVAGKAGISYPFLSEIEKGTKHPSSRKLGQLADALDLRMEELVELSKGFGGDDSQSPGILLASGLLGTPSTSQPTIGSKSDLTELGHLAQAERLSVQPSTSSRTELPDPRRLEAEIREIVDSAVSETLRIWSRDVLPLLVEREVERALATSRSDDED